MAEEEDVLTGKAALDLARGGLEVWNKWAEGHMGWTVDFSFVDFRTPENIAISFKGFVFPGEVGFQDARLDYASFETATFHGVANFYQAQFTKDATFYDARFVGAALFSGARFNKQTVFSRVHFGRSVNFVGAIFGGEAYFDEITFSGFAEFSKATFSGDAAFDGTAFGATVDFVEASFNGHADFGYCRFDADVSFAKARFPEEVITKPHGLFYQASFNRSVFYQRVTFWSEHGLIANFSSTDLERTGVSQEQVNSSLGDRWTILPAIIKHPVHWLEVEEIGDKADNDTGGKNLVGGKVPNLPIVENPFYEDGLKIAQELSRFSPLRLGWNADKKIDIVSFEAGTPPPGAHKDTRPKLVEALAAQAHRLADELEGNADPRLITRVRDYAKACDKGDETVNIFTLDGLHLTVHDMVEKYSEELPDVARAAFGPFLEYHRSLRNLYPEYRDLARLLPDVPDLPDIGPALEEVLELSSNEPIFTEEAIGKIKDLIDPDSAPANTGQRRKKLFDRLAVAALIAPLLTLPAGLESSLAAVPGLVLKVNAMWAVMGPALSQLAPIILPVVNQIPDRREFLGRRSRDVG